MANAVQTKNWKGTNSDDHFVVDDTNYDDIPNTNIDIRGGLGNDTFEINLQDGRSNYFKGEEGDDTYILWKGQDISILENDIDSDGDDSVYIKGNITQSVINLAKGNDKLYIESGDGIDDQRKTTIWLGNGNNEAFISGGSNYSIRTYENLSKIGKSILNVSGGKKHDFVIGGGGYRQHFRGNRA